MSENNAIVTVDKDQAAIVEKVVIAGDLSKLAPAERVNYYRATCQSLGLNPLTQPFQYITLNNRLTLYCLKTATDQLRKLHGVSITDLQKEKADDIYLVTAYATDDGGRSDSSIGAVSIAGLKGDALANAIMKAETKAKRRVTLSLVGLGWLDESEIETIPNKNTPTVDMETGEIKGEVVPATKGGDVQFRGKRNWTNVTPVSKATSAEVVEYVLDHGDDGETHDMAVAPATPVDPKTQHRQLQKGLWAVADKLGWQVPQLGLWVTEHYGGRASKDLSVDELQDALGQLRDMAAAKDN